MHVESRRWDEQTTTDAYVDLGNPWECGELARKNMEIRNEGGANSADVKVLGSIDGITYDIEVKAETAVANSTALEVKVNDWYAWLKVQIKATVPTNQTPVSAVAGGLT